MAQADLAFSSEWKKVIFLNNDHFENIGHFENNGHFEKIRKFEIKTIFEKNEIVLVINIYLFE